ncbi:MAG TPA: hypothetical protein VFX26_03640 [Nitrososphaeraceae archaeon]|nr:hypothetical protein [Nitrososphaeraceae archaeon]
MFREIPESLRNRLIIIFKVTTTSHIQSHYKIFCGCKSFKRIPGGELAYGKKESVNVLLGTPVYVSLVE